MREGVTVSLSAALDAWLADLLLAGRSPRTVRTYRSLLSPLTTDAPAYDLTPDRCRAWLASRMSQSAATVHTAGAALRSFGAYCVERGWLAQNPMAGVPLPHPKPPPHRYLSRDELARIWHACNTDGQRLIVCLLLSGLRASELLAIKPRDVDRERLTLTVLGKGGKIRTVPLDPRTAALMPVSGQKVVHMSYGSLRTIIERLGRRAGVPGLHAHLFRHTFASQWLLSGGDASTLQTLGGWSGDEMIRTRYARSVIEEAALNRARDIDLTRRLLEP